MNDTPAEMPRYKCHKEVHALKIAGFDLMRDESLKIDPVDPRYTAFTTSPDYFRKYKGNAEDKGYFVLYKDGYQSWSPSKEFEEGYSPC